MKFDFREDFGPISDREVSLSLLEDCNSGGVCGTHDFRLFFKVSQHKFQNLDHPQIASPLHV